MAKQSFTAGQVLTAAQQNALQLNDYNQTVSTKTVSYVLVAADAGTRIVMNAGATNTTITVNTSLFAAGDTLQISNISTSGTCTVTAGTCTVAFSGSLVVPTSAGGTLYFTSASSAIFFATGNLDPTVATSNRNGVINGAMSTWQRGTSVATTGSSASFGPDRFQVYRNTTGATMSRQTTGDTTNLPQIYYCSRTQRTVSTTSVAGIFNSYSFETLDSIRFAGQPVTFSFYARAGANYSAASSGLVYALRSGTGTDQNNLDGMTGATNVVSNTATLTTTWQRFQGTATVSSSATQLGILFTFTPVGTAGANDYFEITGVQVEAGSVATPFEFEDIGITLAKCQRYYERFTIYAYRGIVGQAISTTAATNFWLFKKTKRTTPTMSSSGTFAVFSANATGITATAVAFSGTGLEGTGVDITVASGLVAGNASMLYSDPSATLIASAEL